MKKIAVVIVFLISIAFISGCISVVVSDSSQGDLHNHYKYGDDFSIGLGCYERINGYVYNSGNAPADNVWLTFNLVNTRTETIRDSKSIFIGTLGQGQSRNYETTLDGECLDHYRTDFSFGK